MDYRKLALASASMSNFHRHLMQNAENMQRIMQYETYWDFYNGIQWINRSPNDKNKLKTINYCKAIIDRHVEFLVRNGFDIVIPMLHGKFGEDGHIQKIIEDIGIPFVGSGSVSSQLCFNKVSTKKIFDDNGIQTPKWGVIKEVDDLKGWDYPLVIKPIEGGSSIGVIIVKSQDDFRNIDFSNPMLAEEYIDGQELTVGILGNIALPVVEIIPPENRWFDYEAKYNNNTQENIPPKYISKATQQQAQTIALNVHKLCGCRHLSRVDMILRKNRLFILEINTLIHFLLF